MVIQICKKGARERPWSFRPAFCATSIDASTWTGNNQDHGVGTGFSSHCHLMSSWGQEVCKRRELQEAELTARATERHRSTCQLRNKKVAALYSCLLDARPTHTSRDVRLGAHIQVLFRQRETRTFQRAAAGPQVRVGPSLCAEAILQHGEALKRGGQG